MSNFKQFALYMSSGADRYITKKADGNRPLILIRSVFH